MVKRSKISIICGAPGTGKTWLLSRVLEWTKKKGLTVALAAPTGKAAKQMKHATGVDASTIHRMLEPRKSVNGFHFMRGEGNPIDADMVVLDECSMITNSLMASVVRAIDFSKTRLLLIGDYYQLPSISEGAVLRDLIDSKIVPTTELTEIQRNSGDIVRGCHRIKDAKFYDPSDVLDPKNGKNLRHIECVNPQLIQNFIEKIVCDRMPARGYDPVWDVQVLSPVNKRGELSCQAINELLQARLNPNPPVDDYKFRIGDKVIQTKNEQIEDMTGEPQLVVNGDIGSISNIDVDSKKLTVAFFDPDRTVQVPMFNHNLLMAYCITVHRFQGSESPVVVIPMHSSFNYFCNRNWIYTAISRAKIICITIGQMSAIRKAIKTDMANRRVTRLKEKLIEMDCGKRGA